jgi:protein-S-isoprenylcysteine O-methyltransferase Ste14
MARTVLSRLLFVTGLLVVTLLCYGLMARAWGSWSGLLANPARRGALMAGLVMTLVAAFSPVNLSSGRRADFRDLWIMPVALVLAVLMLWLLPFLDRRDRWVIDGDAVRWFGLVLLVAGGALRVWPMFVLGHRFSGLVAIQEGHRLVTDGVYRWIRNPSYLGYLVASVGWALVFRSVAGLLLMLPFVWLLVARIRAEEALLASEFGEQYADYRRRTWRLVPWVY